MKFCREKNVDQHVWKILYYNIIEMLKKILLQCEDNKAEEVIYKSKCTNLIDDGINYFEALLRSLEIHYKFSLDDYLDNNSGSKYTLNNIIAINIK